MFSWAASFLCKVHGIRMDNIVLIGKLHIRIYRFGRQATLFRYTFAVVDKEAILHNVRSIRCRLKPTTKLMIAVKANGYGHGADEVAHTAIAAGADAFAVASVEEGKGLRESGIKLPILVLGAATPRALVEASKYELSVTYTDAFGPIHLLPKMQKPLDVHIKVDTGMNRLGLRKADEVITVVNELRRRSDIRIVGLHTHLACADDPVSPHTIRQIERFDEIASELKAAGIEIPCLHVANSGGALQDYQYDMVRVGISAYGYSPNPDLDFSLSLRPALHLYSFITRLADIHKGEVIGYGATYTASRDMKIATIPIGYADGYPRILSSRGEVLIHGQRASIVGRICMDQLMVDVSSISGVSAGDAVTIFGQDAPQSWTSQELDIRSSEEQIQFIVDEFAKNRSGTTILSLHEIAKMAETISYELMCAVSPRVPRIYVPKDF
jgi:alanine racemase